MNADDVLTVLNGLAPVDMTGWVFAVITDATDNDYWPFERGEIVILTGAYEREPLGRQRKPAKWDVHEECFPTLAEAQACRDQVLAGTWPRSYE